MANNRIFYACQAIAVSPFGLDEFTSVHGVQSVGINTTFNLEQAFELGQIDIYENIEGLPDVEVTVEKVLDGYPLLYRLCTRANAEPQPDNTLVQRSKNRCMVALGIYQDDNPAVSGDPQVQVYMSGMYVNSISYTIPTDGNCTESVTLVGNHKAWLTTEPSGFKQTNAQAFYDYDSAPPSGDKPMNNQEGRFAGGIQRRENVIMMSSVMPSSIFGVGATSDGTPIYSSGNNWDPVLKSPIAHIQSINISTDLSRENILELGRKAPYYRAPNFPVEVTSEFEVIAISGDFISAYEEGRSDYKNTANEGNNTTEEKIVIRLQDGTQFDLGEKNRLSSITYGGADAGGGNATITYSYSTFNNLTIIGPHGNAGEEIPS
jgi:hypothetical protein